MLKICKTIKKKNYNERDNLIHFLPIKTSTPINSYKKNV